MRAILAALLLAAAPAEGPDAVAGMYEIRQMEMGGGLEMTPDGRFRINAFSKTDYDVYNLNNRTKSGVGISYIREYNRFGELFNPARRRRTPLMDSLRQARMKQDSLQEKNSAPPAAEE